jgi:hypothetical protein
VVVTVRCAYMSSWFGTESFFSLFLTFCLKSIQICFKAEPLHFNECFARNALVSRAQSFKNHHLKLKVLMTVTLAVLNHIACLVQTATL